jgi:ATP-dependent protease ClpP protease subunit
MEIRPVVIKFFAPVDKLSISSLINAIDQKLQSGINEFKILISSPGGNVFYGLSAYNYLKGIPATIITHNFGSVDSIGVILYCGGTKRLSVPQARFLIHGVSTTMPQGINLEEKQLEEILYGLRIDYSNIAKVIAVNIGKTEDEVIKAMSERTTLNPQEALSWGLVHEIKSELFLPGSEIITIQS